MATPIKAEQRSPEWFEARLGRPTASRFGDIMAKTRSGYSTSRKNYRAELVIQRLTQEIPRTGEVLILYSSPSFDPNAFSLNDQPRIRSYLKDEKKPLFTRPLQGVYPPGSVFKPVLAVGGLQDKIIDTDFTVEDNGFIKAGSLSFGNWYFLEYGKTEGTVNVLKALKRSNDIFFYKLGEKMGDAKIKLWAERFGYGDKTGIAFPDSSGLVPSAFWKKEVIKDRWFLGDTYNESIGQGYLQVTPLQVNQAIATIVNGGKLCKPKLLKGEAPECTKIGISEETDKTVLEGMRQACAPGGTGWPFFNFSVSAKVDKASSVPEGSSSAIISDSADPNGRRPSGQTPPTTPITVGCKTGTAESHAASGLPHAWFTVFAPFDNPEILLTVMVEESGQGSNVAAPIAKEILKTYFERSE
jgi:penicillin-binding protein 2